MLHLKMDKASLTSQSLDVTPGGRKLTISGENKGEGRKRKREEE